MGALEGAALVLAYVIAVVLNAVIFAACMWVGNRIAGGGGSILHMLFIGVIGAIIAAIPIPIISLVIAFIVMLVLVTRWLGVDAWPEGVFILVVAGCLSLVARMTILMAILTMLGA